MNLNQRSYDLCQIIAADPGSLNVAVHQLPHGGRLIDCGVQQPGGIAAGLMLARICMADLASVQLVPCSQAGVQSAVQVTCDRPVEACLAAQYAGWQIALPDFFAMGSGPMRAVRGKEDVLNDMQLCESSDVAVGVLEGRQLPDQGTFQAIADECGVAVSNLTLLIAPTASQAGNLQVVARSVETALHKMHEKKMDLKCVKSAVGYAPLPPVAADDLAGIGRTNDAVLYGADVTFWVDLDDDQIATAGPGIPAASSADYGQPFAEIFKRYDHDFYKIDPLLFSPARVTLASLQSGRLQTFGEIREDVLRKSFGT